MERLDGLSARRRREILDRTPAVDEASDAAREIVDGVLERGDEALKEYTERFDGQALDRLRVTESELQDAVDTVDDDVLDAVRLSCDRIRGFHERQRRDSWTERDGGVEVGRRFTPLESAGCYVPGGGAAYPSTALMTAVPADVAGVERVVACTPPPAPDATLAALAVAGVEEVYRVGGAQAIAAMAGGTESIDPVDVVVGPGNRYVAAAKRTVATEGLCRTEFPAGPSELGVVADRTANPRFVAADAVAQAEHDPDASVVVCTTSDEVAEEVESEIKGFADEVERGDVVRDASIDVLVGSFDDCVEFVAEYAPEHLSVCVEDERVDGVVERVPAGSVFVGDYTPVAAGDYSTGTNHVLPTAGLARLYGGLSVDDFLRAYTVQELTEDGLRELSDAVTTLARAEGLDAHARSIEVRWEETRSE
ncbi:MAG: histidinol dehydrogenase [Halobacteriales archaeon]